MTKIHQGELVKPLNQGPIHPSDQGQPPNHQVTSVTNNLRTLAFPIPHDFHSFPSTKNIPSTSSFIEAVEKGFNRISVNLNNPSPCHLGLHNEVLPNSRMGLMSLFMVEHPIILCNPNHPQGDAMKEVPNLDFLEKILRNPFPKKGLFPMKVVRITNSDPT